jgi:hypothetical protein
MEPPRRQVREEEEEVQEAISEADFSGFFPLCVLLANLASWWFHSPHFFSDSPPSPESMMSLLVFPSN